MNVDTAHKILSLNKVNRMAWRERVGACARHAIIPHSMALSIPVLPASLPSHRLGYRYLDTPVSLVSGLHSVRTE